jgi:PemK-like protein.
VPKFEVRWVNYDLNKNKSSLTQKVRPAIIMPAFKEKGMFLIPITTVEKKYNKENPYAVKINNDSYALCDQFERVAATDKRLLGKANNIKLTETEIKLISLALEKYTSMSVNNNIKRNINEHSLITVKELEIGDTIKFAEKINNTTRVMVATIKVIDNSISATSMEDYCLLNVQAVEGKNLLPILNNKSNIIRTREDLIRGIELVNNLSNNQEIQINI